MGIPKWRCHKVVAAFKIGRIEGCRLYSFDDETVFVDVSPDYTNRHPLNEAGYYVRYEDGYESWSPSDAFEKGYTQLPA